MKKKMSTNIITHWLEGWVSQTHHVENKLYKKLGSGLSPQSCLYFQGFWGSKLLNGCLVVWPSKHVYEEYSNFQYSKWSVILNFLSSAFGTVEFWCIVGLTAILRLLQMQELHFSATGSFYCCLVKKGRALKVA